MKVPVLVPPSPHVTLEQYLSGTPVGLGDSLGRLLGPISSPVTQLVGSLLRDPNPTREAIERLHSTYQELRTAAMPWLEGALGFCEFGRFVDRDRSSSASDELLSNPSVKGFVSAEYQLPDTVPGTWALHRLGTTSYVIRASNGSAKALKLIRPRYFDRRDICLDTASYKLTFARFQGASPVIDASDSRFVLMEFVEGTTLGQYLSGTNPALEPVVRLANAKKIIQRLCSILHEFHKHQIKHLDLSPDNIILTDMDALEDDGSPFGGVRLIDFGPNHILREGVGTAADFEEVRSYVAPEVIADFSAGTYLSDGYSVGRILLQMITGDERKVDLSLTLDKAWQEQPQLASLIEELIDGDPSNRLLGGARGPSALAELRGRITVEMELQEQIAGSMASTDAITAVGLLDRTETVGILLRTIRALKGGGDEGRRNALRRLAGFAGATVIAQGAVLACFIFVVFDGRWISIRQSVLGLEAAEMKQYLPGLFVGLSFMALAGRYYLNIFARISTQECQDYGPLKVRIKWAERLMRMNAVCFAGFTIFGMLLDARWWPVYCSFGVMAVAANNHCLLGLAKSARGVIEKRLKLPASREPGHFLEEFSKWGTGMFLYMVALWIAAAILIGNVWLGIGNDQSRFQMQCVLAGVAVLVNFVLYRRNCSRRAAIVRGGLHRAIEGLSRVAKRERQDRASVEKTNAV